MGEGPLADAFQHGRHGQLGEGRGQVLGQGQQGVLVADDVFPLPVGFDGKVACLLHEAAHGQLDR